MSQRSTPARPDRTRRARLIASLLAGLSGCAGQRPPACIAAPVPAGDSVYVVTHGWHTDLAIPAGTLRGDMTLFRRIFPGLKLLVVGFGKRTFMMAPVTHLGDLLIGPFPGTGTLLIAGLTTTPDRAYADGTMAVLALPPGGADRLSGFVWRTLQVVHGVPVRIGDGFFPGSVFYASRTGYSGLYTCNSWAADALHAAGLPVSADGVVFAGQAMARARRVAGNACAIDDKP